MPSYVCIVYGRGEQPIAVDVFDSADDRNAAAHAQAFTVRNAYATRHDLWQDNRRVETAAAGAPKVPARRRSVFT